MCSTNPVLVEELSVLGLTEVLFEKGLDQITMGLPSVNNNFSLFIEQGQFRQRLILMPHYNLLGQGLNDLGLCKHFNRFDLKIRLIA